MCGFVGWFDKNNNTDNNIRRMLRTIEHRGPDEQRFKEEGGSLCMGFARLAIIDIAGGSQPMSNDDETVTVMMNGEIYNYIELRNSLDSIGVKCITSSDTEVLLRLYETYGIEALNRLQGMFGLIIVDRNKNILYVARDRIGIKPLYYMTKDTESFIFASEVKPLLQVAETSSCIDRGGLADFLQYRYIHAPHTLFKKILKVKPGHYLELSLGDGHLEDRRYWDCNNISFKYEDYSDYDKVKRKTLDLLRESIKLHLRSDVPLGLFLSGGIDSGLLVGLASEFITNINTYTLRFEDGEYDESKLASLVAKKYNTHHHCYTVVSEDFEKLLPEMIWYYDDPLGDPGILPNYIINKYVKEDGIKVILSGAGGDELFAGYSWYFQMPKELIINRFPHISSIIRGLTKPINPDFASKIDRALVYRESHGLHMIIDQQVFRDEEIVKLIGIQAKGSRIKEKYLNSFYNNELNALLYTDIKTYLTDDLLLLADRSCMAYSVEGRVPFLHHPLVEYALSIPENIKTPNNARKYILKDIAKDYLPDEVINAPKRGFSSPVQKWGVGKFGDFAYDILNQNKTLNRDIWNSEFFKSFVKDRRNYKISFHKVFLLLITELYFRVHVDNCFITIGDLRRGSIY